jgi:hypothetical protein
MNKELDEMTQNSWASCLKHAENLQEDYYTKQIRCDKISEPIIINLQDSNTEHEESSLFVCL